MLFYKCWFIFFGLFLGLSACQTIPQGDDSAFYRKTSIEKFNGEYEKGELLPTAKFLNDMCELECAYQLHSETYNDGLSNWYKVTYEGHVFVVQGTYEASELLNEINVISAFQDTSTVNIVGDTIWSRTTKLVKTPYEIGKSVNERLDEVESLSDAVIFIPSTAVDISKGLVSGVKELGVTAFRLTGNLSNTKCRGLECAQGAAEDLLYGLNVFTGKHKVAAGLHRIYGTDPETQNIMLNREVDRYAYVSSLSDTGFKFALGAANIPVFADASRAIGRYRNANSLRQYEDARKQQMADKKQLTSWGVSPEVVGSFYDNSAFTRSSRRRLVYAFLVLKEAVDVTHSMSSISNITTRYDANKAAALYEYMAGIGSSRNISRISSIPQGLVAHLDGGDCIYVFKGDFLTWSEEISALFISRETNMTNAVSKELHVLGLLSETMKAEVKKRDILIVIK